MIESYVNITPNGFAALLRVREAEASIPEHHYLALNGSQIVACGPWPPAIDLSAYTITDLMVPANVYRHIREKRGSSPA